MGEGALEEEHPRELAGSEATSVQEEEYWEHEEAGSDEERETAERELEDWDLLDYWEYKRWRDDMNHSYGDDPEDWAPVDVKEDWYGPGPTLAVVAWQRPH